LASIRTLRKPAASSRLCLRTQPKPEPDAAAPPPPPASCRSYADHDHKAGPFRKQELAQAVEITKITDASAQQLRELLAMHEGRRGSDKGWAAPGGGRGEGPGGGDDTAQLDNLLPEGVVRVEVAGADDDGQ
jgi:hypothetical protein